MMHVLQDFPHEVGTWLNIVSINQRGSFYLVDLHNWIDLYMNVELGMEDTGC